MSNNHRRVGAYLNGDYLGRVDLKSATFDHVVGVHINSDGSYRWMSDDEHRRLFPESALLSPQCGDAG